MGLSRSFGNDEQSTQDIAWDSVKAQINLAKHRVSFAEAATVLLDSLALAILDVAHSQQEWSFPLGFPATGRLLAVAHAYQSTGQASAAARIVSAREATSSERPQYVH